MVATISIADEVHELRHRIQREDPGAYTGFVSDAAIRRVAEAHAMDWRDVLRLFRAEHPLRGPVGRSIPISARRPSPEALQRATR